MSWTLQDSAVMPYLQVCHAAAVNSDYFNTFKSIGAYRHVLEHVSQEEGQLYLDEIEIDYEDKLDEIKQNDTIGNPVMFDYPDVGTMSPTTIRYIKNVSDIVNAFGTGMKSIVEVGGGYGGLCKVMSSFIDFDNYLLIDLEECNELSRKYLSEFDLPTLSHRGEEIEVEENFDLFISNYALSECDRETQMEYINKFVKKSDRFYLMHNDFHVDHGNMSHQEFVEIMSDTHEVNFHGEHGVESNPKVMYGVIK